VRGTFAKTLTELADRDARIVLLTGDLGYMALEPFAERFPQRFFNVGVAEQNMVGLATGLAEAGFVPFVYSIVTFAVLRPYEFIRNGPVLHQFPVRIVGVGGGMEYGQNGVSHYGLEDVGVTRLQPGLTVIAPADYAQTRSALRATYDLPGPVYYRLGKDDKTQVPGLDGRFALGHQESIGSGADLLLIAMGNITSEVAAAAARLGDLGVHCTLLVVSTLNPPDTAGLAATIGRFRVALTVEEHYQVGGLGSLVSEVIAEQGLACRIRRCGVKTMPTAHTGSQGYLRQVHQLSAEALVQSSLEMLETA
jgi:transketolase